MIKSSSILLRRLQNILRWSLAFIWIYTAIISFFWAKTQGFPLLQHAGVPTQWQSILLYGGTFVDFVLGVLVFLNYKVTMVGVLQLCIIVSYTIIASYLMPDYWVHPLAPLAKNIPICAAIWVWISLDRINHVV